MFLSQPPCTNLHLVRRWRRSQWPAIVRVDGIRMGEFVDEVVGAGAEDVDKEDGGAARTSWERRFVSSDRDWHFEGNIRCSRWEVDEDG